MKNENRVSIGGNYGGSLEEKAYKSLIRSIFPLDSSAGVLFREKLIVALLVQWEIAHQTLVT
tara:strand:+ start:436 stop:621 length:186 start_codon:yes stop_codon:yes gene_type:complete